MNADKAREYFSAYHEGVLERGLAETFERALRTDAQIQAEYQAFERTIQSLETMKSPVAEPEFDLHEAISRRLDKHLYEEKRRKVSPLVGWWKNLALGGLATAALVMAVIQLQSSGDTNTAGIVPVSAPTEKLELISDVTGYRVEFSSKNATTIAIKGLDGEVLVQKSIAAGKFKSPLTNSNPGAALLEIDISGDKEQVFVALPGTRMQPAASGMGSVKDLALALAGFYRVPVLLKVTDVGDVKWDFGPGEPHDAAETALKGTAYNAIKNPDGVVCIQPN